MKYLGKESICRSEKPDRIHSLVQSLRAFRVVLWLELFF